MLAKTEWYIVILAAFTMSLIYYRAFGANLTAVSGATNATLGQVMGQHNGVFQAPF